LKTRGCESTNDHELRRKIKPRQSFRFHCVNFTIKIKPEFATIIRDIGLDKFYVIYFNPEQLFLYKQFIRQTGKTGILSIDSMESLIKSIKEPNDSTDFIFLSNNCSLQDKNFTRFANDFDKT